MVNNLIDLQYAGDSFPIEVARVNIGREVIQVAIIADRRKKPTDLDSDNDVAGRKRASWCQRVAAQVAELQSQLNRVEKLNLSDADREIAKKTRAHLNKAREATNDKGRLLAKFTGAGIDKAYSNIHRAEVQLLHLTPDADLTWRGTVVLAQARQHLGPSDPRLQILENRLATSNNELQPPVRELAVTTLLAAHDAEESERAQARSFRNILAASFIVTSIIAALFVIWGYVKPDVLPPNLCFGHTCPVGSTPDGTDVAVVEAVGTGAAVLAGAVSLRSMQGTSTPYSVPAMLVLLRIPVGALSALFAICLINGRFIPGLTRLDTGPQIIAWAIAFGIIQETVTRMVDRQGDAVLSNVRGSERGFGDNSPKP
jgi:hypothetical protein